MEEIVSYLIRLSDGKLQLLNSMYELTLDQEKALKDNNIDMLDKVIVEKQELIRRIDVLDKEFLEKYETVKRGIGFDKLEEITEEPVIGFKSLQLKIKQILDVLEKIRVVDESNIKRVKLNVEESKKQLKSVRVGKKAYSQYNKKPMEGASIFIDNKK